MEGASGLAGLIKTLFVLEKGIIPPNLWFEKANPRIPMDRWRLKVNFLYLDGILPFLLTEPRLGTRYLQNLRFGRLKGFVVQVSIPSAMEVQTPTASLMMRIII